jgi:hypothetical protein
MKQEKFALWKERSLLRSVGIKNNEEARPSFNRKVLLQQQKSSTKEV